VSLLSEAASIDVPLLGTEGTDEFFVVRYHDDTALVVADGNSQSAKRVTIQEVGRLVEDEEMRVVPVRNVSIAVWDFRRS
jgi:hypothetical protein